MPARTKTRTDGKSGQRSERYTHALMLLTRKIWHDDCTLSAALAEICEGAAAALEVPRVNVWRYDSSEERLVCLHSWCADSGGHAAASELETIALDGSYSALLDEVRVIDAADVGNSPVSSDDELAAYYRRHGICSLLDAPVRMQGHLVGVICHEQTQCARPWAQEEQTFAASMGDFVAMAMEIQRRRDAEQALEHLRLHDMGTDLPNREYFLELLRLRLRALRAGEQLIAVVHISIALPYATTRGTAGPTVDDVMTGVADVLRQSVGAECSIARVRADGFALLPQRHTSEVDVTELAERCVAIVLDLSPWHDTEVGAAVGVAFSREADEGDARVLMRRAEQSANLAATRGRYEYEVFDIEHHRGLVERLHLEQALRSALVEDAFEVHYQPEFDLRTGTWSAAEALVRWRRDGRILAASEFIEVAESASLILPLGRWVLSRACRDAARWPKVNGVGIAVRVNLSARQFDEPSLLSKIEETLDRSRLDPARLCLEITETTLMREGADTIAVMRRLKELGVGLAIDDFGTGYSSLSYLKRFPLDVLKIDRSFVEGLPDQRVDAAIVGAIASLARALGLEVVGEGVETIGQQDALAQLGVTRLQGWLYSNAVPQSEFLELIARPARTLP